MEYYGHTDPESPTRARVLEVPAVNDIVEEVEALLQEHKAIGMATGSLQLRQDALTTTIETLSLRLREIRRHKYRLARFYRTQWCGAHTYATALEDVIQKLNVPLPCPLADDDVLEGMFSDHDPPTNTALWARWNLETAHVETEKPTLDVVGRVADAGSEMLATLSQKRPRA